MAMGGFRGTVHTRLAQNTALAVLAVPPEQVGAGDAALAEANCFAAIVPGPADDLAAHAAQTGVRVIGRAFLRARGATSEPERHAIAYRAAGGPAGA